ncbi:MAG: hypothetical protein CHACPFDD_03342 [Phycisphaerae bacterium]|nr:hypothetical protein [Phycisphaerae bacterium]
MMFSICRALFLTFSTRVSRGSFLAMSIRSISESSLRMSLANATIFTLFVSATTDIRV